MILVSPLRGFRIIFWSFYINNIPPGLLLHKFLRMFFIMFCIILESFSGR